MTPDDRRYSKTHEWVKVEADSAVVGITDHAQHELGDIVYVEPPAVGRAVKAGTECGIVESVKAASDLYSPLDGEVTEVNTNLAANPQLVNEDPYGGGWLFKLGKADAGQLAALLSAKDYEASLPE